MDDESVKITPETSDYLVLAQITVCCMKTIRTFHTRTTPDEMTTDERRGGTAMADIVLDIIREKYTDESDGLKFMLAVSAALGGTAEGGNK